MQCGVQGHGDWVYFCTIISYQLNVDFTNILHTNTPVFMLDKPTFEMYLKMTALSEYDQAYIMFCLGGLEKQCSSLVVIIK